jgi:hypothetical protein
MRRAKYVLMLATLLFSSILVFGAALGAQRSWNLNVDLRQLENLSSSVAAKVSLPSLDVALSTLGLGSFEAIRDANGLFATVAPPGIKSCCMIGLTGAREHIVRVSLLEGGAEGEGSFTGLQIEITGYCTIPDVAFDLSEAILKLESTRKPFGVSNQQLYDNMLKVLTTAHYKWYMESTQLDQLYLLELAGMLPMTLVSNPGLSTVRLMWPAADTSAVSLDQALKAYATYKETDQLGIETIIKTDFNALALSCDESVIDSDTGGT